MGIAGVIISAVLQWLAKHWRLAAALIIVAVVGIAFKVVLHERDSARAQVAKNAVTIHTLTEQKDALLLAEQRLSAAIEKQGASIDALRSASESAQARAKAAMEEAAKQHQRDASKIADLNRRGADKSNKGSCDAEIARIRAGL